jgi:hypothetical protein
VWIHVGIIPATKQQEQTIQKKKKKKKKKLGSPRSEGVLHVKGKSKIGKFLNKIFCFDGQFRED